MQLSVDWATLSSRHLTVFHPHQSPFYPHFLGGTRHGGVPAAARSSPRLARPPAQGGADQAQEARLQAPGGELRGRGVPLPGRRGQDRHSLSEEVGGQT